MTVETSTRSVRFALVGFLASSSASNDVERPLTQQFSFEAASTPEFDSDPRLAITEDAISALVARSRDLEEVEPIHPASASAARTLLMTLLERVIQSRLSWEPPHVSTEGAGDLMLRWRGPKERSLSLHLAGGPIEFLQAWGPDLSEEMLDGRVESPEQLLDLWRWLYEV